MMDLPIGVVNVGIASWSISWLAIADAPNLATSTSTIIDGATEECSFFTTISTADLQASPSVLGITSSGLSSAAEETGLWTKSMGTKI